MGKLKSLMIVTGVALIALAAGVGWIGYQRLHSPLDAVASVQAQAVDSPFISTGSPLPSDPLPALDSIPADQGVAAVNPPDFSTDLNHSKSNSPAFFQGFIPDHLIISSISLNAPIVPTTYAQIMYSGRKYFQWLVPYGAMAGWQDTSALLGVPGNTVFNGHNNSFGEVFKNLANVNEGDLIQVYSGHKVFQYRVAAKMILPERFEDVSVRLQNARWITSSSDERLTLVTCWPADDSTNRLVVVAFPVPDHEFFMQPDHKTPTLMVR